MAQTPRYLSLAATLRKKVLSGRYAIGDQIPTEHELCAKHDVSRHTARAALQLLESEGLIERRPGLGTRVISSGGTPSFTQPLGGLDDLLQYAHEAKLAISASSRATLSREEAERLGAASASKWLRLDGLRRIGARPMAATTIFISAAIRAKPSDFESTNLAVTERIDEKYGVAVQTIRQRIMAEALGEEDAAALDATTGEASLRTIRRYYDAADRLFVISDSRHPGGRFSYETTFRRTPVR